MDDLDRWLDQLQVALAFMAAGELRDATNLIAALPHVPLEKPRGKLTSSPAESRPTIVRQPLTPRLREQTLQRDHFTCGYCGRRLLHPRVPPYLTDHFPQLLPYTPAMPEKDAPGRLHTHFGFVRTYPEIDHVIPGAGNDPNNLVSACTPCNNYKGDRRPEDLPGLTTRSTIPHPGWDGLYGLYLQAATVLPPPTA
jgi:5-methylcytosine-specific restriction endonuclease McrA